MQLAFAVVNGLASGMAMFLVAAGVTLIFGILKVLNFSHGAFFMLGAYVAFAVLGESTSVTMLLVSSVAGGILVAACGYLTDKIVLGRLRNFDEHYVLIATFALLMVVTGIIKLIWGLGYHSVMAPNALSGIVDIGGLLIPTYSLFVVLIGLIVFLLLDIGIHRMRVGKLIQSLVHDNWMVSLLGYNVPMFYTGTVVLSFFLAGFAGGILLPNQSLSTSLGETYILLGFVTVIIGGLGSIRGAFVAALLLGLIESLSSVFINSFPGLTLYVAMVIMLLVRPQGLFGGRGDRPIPFFQKSTFTGARASIDRTIRASLTLVTGSRPAFAVAPDRRFSDREIGKPAVFAATALVLAGLSLPLWANPGLMFIAGLCLIQALFAVSWNFLFSYAGITSFGHAAFYALGAYTVGILLKSPLGLPFFAILLLSAAAGAILAAIIGVIALRRSSGVFLAILTMAVAEICRIVISYIDILGRDDGLASVPRPVINFGLFHLNLAPDVNYYWFLCIFVSVMVAAIWWLAHSRFGRALSAIRQDPERTTFLGTDIFQFRLAAFVISGAFAALCGGLMAPWTQIVTPELANLLHSTAPILSTLLGGANSFWGPIVGAVAFSIIGYSTRNLAGLSEIIIGSVLLTIVLVAPFGLIGLFKKIVGQRVASDSHDSAPRSAPAVPRTEEGR